MFTFEIELKNLKAVAYAMAAQDIRYYLNGVLFENNGKETRLVATDGHRLHAAMQENEAPMREMVSFIMPDTMVKQCLKAKTPRGWLGVIQITYESGKITAKLPDGSMLSNMAVDGKFPDYMRVIPSDTTLTPEPAIFQSDYILDAEKGLRDFEGTRKGAFPSMGLTPRGNNVSVLSVPGFVAVIMPMRVDFTPCADIRFTQPMQQPENIAKVAA